MGVHELLVRYFDCNIIGSFLFVQQGLLLPNDVNDIDINIVESQISQVRKFLNDQGYKETKPAYKHPGYEGFEGNKVFTKEGHLNIHLLSDKSLLRVYSIGELIAAKYDRGQDSDFKQLSSVLKYKTAILCNTK